MAATTIAIATHKGGTGKTVTAMALGAALLVLGQQCLLVDLDPQGHSTLGLGVKSTNVPPTLRDFFHEPPLPLSRVIRETHITGLTLSLLISDLLGSPKPCTCGLNARNFSNEAFTPP